MFNCCYSNRFHILVLFFGGRERRDRRRGNILKPPSRFLPPRPNDEVLYLEILAHITLKVDSFYTDTGEEETKLFSILNDLRQLIRELTHISDLPNQFLNTFDIFLSNTSFRYKCIIFHFISNSENNIVALNDNIFSPLSPLFLKYFLAS